MEGESNVINIGNKIVQKLVLALSLGISEKEFKGLTPYQIFLRIKADELSYKKDKQIELMTLNRINGFMGINERLEMNEFLGIKKVIFKTLEDFKYDVKKFSLYINDLIDKGVLKSD